MLLFIVLIFSINSVLSSKNLSVLPPIFHLDDYTKCRQNHQNFCHITIELLPSSEDNVAEIWSLIEFTKNSFTHYDHSRLHYGICVENHCEFVQDNRKLVVNLENYYSEKYKELGLKARILDIDCNNYDNIYTANLYDWIVLYLFIAYFLLITGATFYHYSNLKKSKTINKYLLQFSLINNYRKFINSVDSIKFKYIQGIRFYSTLFVIAAHTCLSYEITFIENTEFIEDIYKSAFYTSIMCLFLYVVQTYFLLTGWLLAYNSFRTFESSPKLNMKRYICLTFINRYLRVVFTLAVGLNISMSTWYRGSFYGPMKHMISDSEFRNCRQYWWLNVLFINNLYNIPICYLVSWYLAADTQLYLLSLLLLAIIWTNQRRMKILIATPMIVAILIQIIVIYVHNYDVVFRVVPKKFPFKYDFEFFSLYTSTYLQIPTFLIGITFGYFHHKYGKNIEIYRNNVVLSNWRLFFIGLPLSSIFISINSYNRLMSAIFAAILKPMYSLGIAIGLFGMLYDSSVMKRVLEWKPVVLLGGASFSTYLSHFLFIFNRSALLTSPMKLSNWIYFSETVRDIIVYYLLGICVHLTVELPALQLQKMLLPKEKND